MVNSLPCRSNWSSSMPVGKKAAFFIPLCIGNGITWISGTAKFREIPIPTVKNSRQRGTHAMVPRGPMQYTYVRNFTSILLIPFRLERYAPCPITQINKQVEYRMRVKQKLNAPRIDNVILGSHCVFMKCVGSGVTVPTTQSERFRSDCDFQRREEAKDSSKEKVHILWENVYQIGSVSMREIN